MLVFIRAAVLRFRHFSDGEPQDGRHSTQLIQLYRDKPHHFRHMTIQNHSLWNKDFEKVAYVLQIHAGLRTFLKENRGKKSQQCWWTKSSFAYRKTHRTINAWHYWSLIENSHEYLTVPPFSFTPSTSRTYRLRVAMSWCLSWRRRKKKVYSYSIWSHKR